MVEGYLRPSQKACCHAIQNPGAFTSGLGRVKRNPVDYFEFGFTDRLTLLRVVSALESLCKWPSGTV
jgi:hypothetical protein